MADDAPGSEELRALLEENVLVLRIASALRHIALSTFRLEDAEHAVLNSVTDHNFFCRTHARYGTPTEERLFRPLVELLSPLLDGRDIVLKCALVGYNAEGAGTSHNDGAIGVRVCVSLFPDGKTRSIYFSQIQPPGADPGPSAGRARGKATHAYVLREQDLYAATSLARGAAGPTRVSEGQVKHRAEGPPWDLVLVLDFQVQGTGKEKGDVLKREVSTLQVVKEILTSLCNRPPADRELSSAQRLLHTLAGRAARWNGGAEREKWSVTLAQMARDRLERDRAPARPGPRPRTRGPDRAPARPGPRRDGAAGVPARRPGVKGGSSLYRGVTFCISRGKWVAQVRTKGKKHDLGGYKDEEMAAKAYDKAVIKFRGKDADTNFPAEEYAEEMREMPGSVEEFICELRSEAKRQNKPKPTKTGYLLFWDHMRDRLAEGEKLRGRAMVSAIAALWNKQDKETKEEWQAKAEKAKAKAVDQRPERDASSEGDEGQGPSKRPRHEGEGEANTEEEQ